MSPAIPSLAIALTLLVAAVPAQDDPVRVLGVVTATANGFGIEDTSIRLSSTTIDLGRFVGRAVDLRGKVRAAKPPQVVVTAIAQTLARHSVGNETRIGRALDLRIDAPQAVWLYYFLSGREGFLPFEFFRPMISGTLLLDARQVQTVMDSAIQNGTWTGQLPIPMEPLLIGQRARFQVAVAYGSGQVLYLNVDEVVLRAP